MPRLEEVFKVSGVPTFTFVEPASYSALRVSLRTPGRCLVVEGPSGIGKTTSVVRILEELGSSKILILTARKPDDAEMIAELPRLGNLGTVVVDDFHRLNDGVRGALADLMKVFADSEDPNSKLILIGINKAGENLITFGTDLAMRIDIFKMEANSPEKVDELFVKGEKALGIQIQYRSDLVSKSQGSFQIAQMLGRQMCLHEGVTEGVDGWLLSTSSAVIIEQAMSELRALFHPSLIEFARGSKLRREGRAPYLHILKWLSEGTDWSLDLREEITARPVHRTSVGQVIDKGFLENLMIDKAKFLENLIHFQPTTAVISVEDPRLVFYLKNLVWKNFSREAGYSTAYFVGSYDIALSFAGEDRILAQKLAELMAEREISVFYDENEQSRILSRNIEDYLAPIYRSEANFVVALLSKNYPKKIWTNFEGDNFKHRFGDETVIAVKFSDTSDDMFSVSSGIGRLNFDVSKLMEDEASRIVDIISKKLEDDRPSAVVTT